MNVYEIVTERIMEQMEQGIIPWERPWTGGKDGAYSRSTGKAYSFINQMLLKHTGEYLTYKQAQEAGGTVRKGEKSEIVVFYKPLPIKEKNPLTGEEEEKNIPLLRYYNVFHISQCDGVEPKYKPEEVEEFDPIEEAEALAVEYTTRENIALENVLGNRAFYQPGTDKVVLPLKSQFDAQAGYYSTLFHELVHSTGHSSRLNRIKTIASFGGEEYSKEELVAEIGAATILNKLQIETDSSIRNNAAYVQSWLTALRKDKRMIVFAAGQAEKAVNLIYNV